MRLRSENLRCGVKTISDHLIKVGMFATKAAIQNWIYRGKKPFNEVILHKIPETAKELSKEKAYVLGVLCGDGWLTTKYRIGLEVRDKDFIDYFQLCLERVYNLRCGRSIRPERLKMICGRMCRSREQQVLTLTSKRVVEDLLRYLPSFRTFDWRVPDAIRDSDAELKSYFLRGLFDSEGCVRYRRNGYASIQLYSANFKGLTAVSSLLFSIGVRNKLYRKLDNYFYLDIADYSSLKLYGDKIGFIIARKQGKLLSALSSYKRGSLNKYSPDLKRSALSLLTKYRDHFFVAQLLGVKDKATIYDWQKAQLNGRL